MRFLHLNYADYLCCIVSFETIIIFLSIVYYTLISEFKLDWSVYYFLLNNTRVRPSYFRLIAISDSVASSSFGISHHLLSRLRGVLSVYWLSSHVCWCLCICTFGSCELSIVVTCIPDLSSAVYLIYLFWCDYTISVVVIMSCSGFFISHSSFVLDLDWIYIFGSNLHNSNRSSSKA